MFVFFTVTQFISFIPSPEELIILATNNSTDQVINGIWAHKQISFEF